MQSTDAATSEKRIGKLKLISSFMEYHPEFPFSPAIRARARTYFFRLLAPDARIREINLAAGGRVFPFRCGEKRHVNKASALLFPFSGVSFAGCLVGPLRAYAHTPVRLCLPAGKPSTRVDIPYSSRRRRGDTPICQPHASAFFPGILSRFERARAALAIDADESSRAAQPSSFSRRTFDEWVAPFFAVFTFIHLPTDCKQCDVEYSRCSAETIFA